MAEQADGAVDGAAAPTGGEDAADTCSAYQLLSKARQLVPSALEQARRSKGFTARWKTVESKIEHLPECLSDLSSHPCFSRNDIFREQLQSVCRTLTEVIELSRRHGDGDEQPCIGKLQMQSTLDSLSGKLDLNLKDCRLLMKTGVLEEYTLPRTAAPNPAEPDPAHSNVGELLARLHIGHDEAKHRAVDGLLAAMKEDDKVVTSALSRSNIAALVHLLMAASPRIREKAAEVIRMLIELGICEELLVSEGVLPPMIRLAESGSSVSRESAVASLRGLSRSPDTARCIVGHGGVSQLVEMCQTGDSITQAAAAAALRNLSAVPEVRQPLVEEGIIRVMINLLGCGMVSGCKEHAAECLQNLTASNDSLRRAVLADDGLRSLLLYLDGPSPPESAVGALRNLVGSVPPEMLISMGLLPRLLHAMWAGSVGAQQAAASAICKISTSSEMKKSIGEVGCLPLLISMLDAKTNGAREVAAQALSSLMSYSQNAREVKKDIRSVPNLVHLLETSPHNTAKKYAVACLLRLSTSKRCRKLMISYGAVGYLKKLSEMDIVGSKRLLERLERGKLRSLFSRR
ncbi:hypothetical protein Taro_031892 [Colocasia esculenta]|uniref:DUF7032 domain-containing protein n=1 Tax=Colocasia esculenta TaxID=4460 RepID=A0A843W4H4_COLES|nr:hypothetical protein [Colocasia esculenta]